MNAPVRAALEAALGVSFHNPEHLSLALVHRSYCAEHSAEQSNERLEFLGDAVLGLVVTRFIYANYPEHPEGELAKVRAAVVNAETLAEVAAEVGLGPALLLGRGEAASGGSEKPSILSDAMEAVFGALYLDQGWDVVQECILRLLTPRIEAAASGPGGRDYKTRLQEVAAQRFEQVPKYSVTHDGPDHARQFYAEVKLAGEVRGRGTGRSKKQAEQAAAREAWAWVHSAPDDARTS
ncbi:MAG: ribonuclease III [Acidimicrobiia bacterium]